MSPVLRLTSTVWLASVSEPFMKGNIKYGAMVKFHFLSFQVFFSSGGLSVST